jgi:APA family basic amino acid/polyamine antiporter
MDNVYKLKFGDLFAMGLGFTIGGAVFSLTGVSIGLTGTSTFLVYIVGAFTILFSQLPTIIAGSVAPRTSVNYSLSKETFGKYGGGIYFWLFFIGRIAMAMNCTAFAMYFTSVFTTLNPSIVGVTVCIVFFISNIFGLKTAVKIQKLMNYVLYTALLLFVIIGIPKVDFNMVFAQENFLKNGAAGFMSAISLIIFSLGGGMSVLDFGGMVENPKKTLPKVCFAVAITVGILFAGMALVGGGVAPPSEAAYKPLSFAAGRILNRPLFLFFILGGCCLAITTTINAGFNWYSTNCLRAVDDGWLPKIFAKRNKYGSPYILQIIWLFFGIIPIVLGISNTIITQVSTGLQILCNIIPNFGLLIIPKLYMNEWKQSFFYVKNKIGFYALTFLPIILTAVLVFFNFRTYPPMVRYCVFGAIGIGIIYILCTGPRIDKDKVLKKE